MGEGQTNDLDWLAGGGAMAETIRAIDWSKNALGPLESWPQSLRTTVSLCLGSKFPIAIAWGPSFIQIYNDGYRPICGALHPRSMGQDFRECWEAPWPVIGAAFAAAVRGEASYLENQRMFAERNGFLEETFFTFSFSPIRDETGGVVGLFHPVTETTSSMLGERRIRALRDIGAGKATSIREAAAVALRALAEHALDLPYALLYFVHDGEARLVASSGIPRDHVAAPSSLPVGEPGIWPFAEAFGAGASIEVDTSDARFALAGIGPYREPPTRAMVFPIVLPGTSAPSALLVAGGSARLPFDEAYRDFFELLAAALATTLGNARAYEEERRRSEALAELDRAKTAFFSNVSHELRTPLTLILAPLEDMLAGRRGELDPAVASDAQIMHRSASRLLKLVNTLLDFSRVEADRAAVLFAPLDLSAATRDLASEFRSTIERAGLALVVECPPLGEPVFVDPEMWEKIVLNLLSNAYKYTLAGSVSVRTRLDGPDVVLSVEDTGAGIDPKDLSTVFERFRRVEGARGRSHEGTGIGLALVRELVRIHGGEVTVTSTVGRGSSFVVRIPRGRAHLDPALVRAEAASVRTRGRGFVDEAAGWSSSSPSAPCEPTLARSEAPRRRVVLADDNADMRDYVRRLLDAHYDVVAVEDGAAALAAIRASRPDLVLSDVMMPIMDGIALVKAIRADASLRGLPVVLLSARAGEEARVDGLEHGADDYLLKPFSARELLARIQSQLELLDTRREVIRHELLANELLQAVRMRDEFLSVASHELRTPLTTLALQSEALLGDCADETVAVDATKVHRRARVLVRQTQRLQALVDSLLELSRLAAGRMRLAVTDCDLAEIVHGVVERVDSASRARITLTIEGKTTGRWDRVRVEQVITNVLSNAIKFGRDEPVEVQVLGAGPQVAVTVRDHGIGIAQEDQQRIFQQFERGVSERVYGGLGLGLWIARALMDAMRGSIVVDSALGSGAAFVLTFPCEAPS